MAKLFLLRHIKSKWNEENRFAGWTDGPLARNEIYKAKEIAEKIFQFKIDKIYSSSLFRNEDTIARIFECDDKKYPLFMHLDKGKMKDWGHFIDISTDDVPVFITESLNEKYYGDLQGENKEKIMEKYGKEKVHLWRRSYKIAPPGGESMADVYKRTNIFYRKYIEKDLKLDKNVLIVASHNSLRSIIKYIEKISNHDIINLEIPYGGLIEYEFNDALMIKNKREL